MRIDTRRTGDAFVISPHGDVDMDRSPSLRGALMNAQRDRPGRIIVDLAGVGYMDSSGVATLVEAVQKGAKAGTRIILCAMNDRVRSIFEIARLDSVFTIAPSVSSALGV